MIEIKRYEYEESGSPVQVMSTLTARLNLYQDASPKERNLIKQRLDLKGKKLRDYLAQKESLTRFNGGYFSLKCTKFGSVYNEEDTSVKISRPFSSLTGLSLDILAFSKGKIPEKELFDIEALNHFILTGEGNYRELERTTIPISQRTS